MRVSFRDLMAKLSVFLNVKNIEKSMALYSALGFETTETYDGEDGEIAYADMELDGAELTLGEIGANDDPEFVAWVSTPLGAGVMLTFNVDDPDAFFAKAKGAGADIESPPGERPYGRAFTMNDVDGYTVTFLKEK